MTACDCPVSGWCERHKVKKSPHWHRLCQTRDDYRAMWDAGRGPGQPQGPLTPEQLARHERVREAAARQQRLIGWLRLLRHTGEVGAGDTAQRLSDTAVRSPDAKALIERLLRQCSCSREKAVERLNQDWPW